jgi:uncharacterized protein YkwD
VRRDLGFFRTAATLVVACSLLVPVGPADAAAGEWVDGLRKWATGLEEKVRAEWQGQREAQRLAAQAQADAAARAQQLLLEQALLVDGDVAGLPRIQVIPPPPGFLTPQESAMIDAINVERTAAGLPPVEPELRLVESARAHSARMRDTAALDHTPRRELASVVPGRPRKVSENIGVGWSVDSLHRTFMVSGSHKGLILGRFEYVGVGIVVSPGRMWVTQQFMRTR